MTGQGRSLAAALLAVVMAGACGGQPAPVAAGVAEAAADGVSASVAAVPLSALKVASVGGGRGKQSVVFLNSKADYRDPDNLSVMVRPDAARALEEALGGPLKETLGGRTISVRGEVQRVEIKPRARAGETGDTRREPWFQNRIEVTSADQVVLD